MMRVRDSCLVGFGVGLMVISVLPLILAEVLSLVFGMNASAGLSQWCVFFFAWGVIFALLG